MGLCCVLVGSDLPTPGVWGGGLSLGRADFEGETQT